MSQVFTSVGQNIRASALACPSSENSGLISLRIAWFDLLAVQGTLKSLLQHHSSKASILQGSAFFMAQVSYPYMITGKTIALRCATALVATVSVHGCELRPSLRRPLQSASPRSLVTMCDQKAVIKNVNMLEEMQQDSMECATQALEKYNIEKDIVAHIKKEFDKKYNPSWHYIVEVT